MSGELYESDHFADVLGTNALKLVYSEQDLINALNNVLQNPAEKHQERQTLVQKLCFKVDGQSSRRIADVLFGEIS